MYIVVRVTHACMITVDCVCIADVYGMYRILSRVVVLTEFLMSLLFFFIDAFWCSLA